MKCASLITLFAAVLPSLFSLAASARCQPYDKSADRETPALELYCRGYACLNSGRRFDKAGTFLLNTSSLRGFVPSGTQSSAQLCAAHQAWAEDISKDMPEDSRMDTPDDTAEASSED